MQQDRRRNPHKPITPESQRKPVKKKETNLVKKNQNTRKNNQKPAPQSLIPPTHTHNHYHGSLKLNQKWIKTHEILGDRHVGELRLCYRRRTRPATRLTRPHSHWQRWRSAEARGRKIDEMRELCA